MAEPLILVTGGTGTLGALVVARLRAARRRVRVLSRAKHDAESGVAYVVGDLVTNTGVQAAVKGVGVIIHLASTKKDDVAATRNLVEAASALKTPPHVIFVSIVGADRVDSSYMVTKLESERVIRSSELPWTILRTTQFYELALTGAQRSARFPLIFAISGFLVQPVDADEVAARVVELAAGEPAGRAPDLGGPEVMSAAAIIRSYLRATKRRGIVVPFWMPGLNKIRAGGLLVRKRRTPAASEGAEEAEAAPQLTWEEFLKERV